MFLELFDDKFSELSQILFRNGICTLQLQKGDCLHFIIALFNTDAVGLELDNEQIHNAIRMIKLKRIWRKEHVACLDDKRNA
jgi:hypothetical protein